MVRPAESGTTRRSGGGFKTITSLDELKGLFGGNLGGKSLQDILTSPQLTGGKNVLSSDFYQSLQSGLLGLERKGAGSVSTLAGADLFSSSFGDQSSAIADAYREAAANQASSDRASQELQASLERERLAEQKRQFDEDIRFRREQEAFQQKDITSQRLLEAAGLATGPTGAIQLAYLARGQGAPQEQVASIFQNLPFVKALLAGEALPGFGLPEQLGGTNRRVTSAAGENVIRGQNLGVTIPGKTAVTQQQFEGLNQIERGFLGALGQSETGQAAGDFLEDITRSFLPTTNARALSL